MALGGGGKELQIDQVGVSLFSFKLLNCYFHYYYKDINDLTALTFIVLSFRKQAWVCPQRFSCKNILIIII